MLGCALGISRLWFTLGFSIVNAVYSSRVDILQTSDLGFIVADGEGFRAKSSASPITGSCCWRRVFLQFLFPR